MACFTDPNVHEIVSVYYFSAYATWLPGPYQRHQAYVKALSLVSVEAILGNFKEKQRSCRSCHARWMAHEEKESDVNLAVKLIEEAEENNFDDAFLVTGDSDLAPPMRYVKRRFPEKKIKVIAPPKRRHSKELGSLAHKRAAIKIEHLEACQLPEAFYRDDGTVLLERPLDYAP